MAPVSPLLDPATLRALEQFLASRLPALDANGPGCRSCRDAEARAFLAKLQVLLKTALGGGLTSVNGPVS